MARTRADTLDFLVDNRVMLGTVSGILTTNKGMIERVTEDCPDLDMITTKSYQVVPNKGNREPIIVETGVGNFGNAVGLKNPGMMQGTLDIGQLTMPAHQLLNISLSASSISDFAKLIRAFAGLGDMYELNFSCPHAAAGYGSAIGSDPKIVAEYMSALSRVARDIGAPLLFPKLTPNVDNIGDIAKVAMDNGADGISAINTVGPECYRDPHTGEPILFNPKGHMGGKSGEWIKEIALEKVAQIRQAIGPLIPIIGMGGVSNGQDVLNMMAAGANVVGIGSAFARVAPKDWGAYVAALKQDATLTGVVSGQFLGEKRVMEYRRFKIASIHEHGKTLRTFRLEGDLDYDASQFAFIWVPGVGEKPFSIANGEPLTFVVRKREYNPEENRGLVTNALFDMQEGEELMVRGVYGADAPDTKKDLVYIVAGGTGIAVVPRLAKKFHEEHKDVTVYCGVATGSDAVLPDEIMEHSTYIVIPDKGVPGRVVDVMHKIESSKLDAAFYNIGPVPFMEKAVEMQRKFTDPANIYVSLETNNMCGVGMCGECECGGVMTCQEGTFFSVDWLEKNGINIRDYE